MPYRSFDQMTPPGHVALLWAGPARGQCASMPPQAESGMFMQQVAGAFENSAIGTSLLALDHRALTGNRALCEFLGYTEAEMLAHSVGKTVHPDEAEEDWDQLALLLDGERDSYRREKRYVHKCGHILWGEFTCTLVRGQDGRPLFFITQVQDITARKQADLHLRESELRLRRLRDLSSDWYWEQDDRFRFVQFLSDKEAPPWRNNRPDLIGHCRWDLPSVYPLQGTWEDHRSVLKAHQPFRNFEYVDLANPAAPYYISISGEPMVDAAGRLTGYWGTARNITDSKVGEICQRETQAMLNMAAQVGRLGAWVFDVGSLTLTWSEEVCAIHDVKPGFLPTLNEAMAFIAPEHKDKIGSTFRNCVKGGSPFDVEAEIVTAKGRRVWVRVICEAEWDAQGRVRRLQGALQDISESKRAQREILRLNAELEERVRQRTAQLEAANRELEAFSYSVAHDLRAPLGAIDGFSKALEHKAGSVLDDSARHYLTRIRAGVKQMGDLTEGLLSLANLSRADLCAEPVDVAALARAALALCSERSPERAVDITVADVLPAKGDPRLMAQVIGNLVNNAWKFTSHRPRAAIEVGGTPGADGQWVYFVRDNGAGFDMAYASKMFEAFQRMHSSTEFEGTGIGLAIVHRIIARHGGRIWAEGVPDQGARFYFTLGACGA